MHLISGHVYEDVNGDSDLTDSVGRPGASVLLYRDGGDGLPNGFDDSFVTSDVTGPLGGYTFLNMVDDTYWVAVDSKTVSSNGGFNFGFGQGDAWLEQTYGTAGAQCDDGAGGTTERATDGACYGGRDGTVSDDASAIGSSEHVTRVSLSGADVFDEDFGFSANVVVNALAGDGQDDDVLANRTVQGSFRQFLDNGAATQANSSMRFVPVQPTNDFGGGGAWWEIQISVDLPDVSDDFTAIDGTAYQFSDGVSLRNTNPGVLGVGGTAGVDGLPVAQVNRPELEIVDGAGRPVGLNFTATADDVTVRSIAIYGFGTNFVTGNVVLAGGQRPLVEQNVIGTEADSFTDPGPGARTGGVGIYSNGAVNGTIRDNLVGFTENPAIRLIGNCLFTVEGNKVRGATDVTDDADGFDIWRCSGTTVRGNLIAENRSNGLALFDAASPVTVENNTITRNGISTSLTAQISGIRNQTSGSTFRRNVIFENCGAGIMIRPFADRNLITENSIYDNGTSLNPNCAVTTGQIGIDLLAPDEDESRGTPPYVTANDPNDVDAGGNNLLNFPVIYSATISGGNITVIGEAPPEATIEFFEASADGSGYGEGETFVASRIEGSGNETNPASGIVRPALQFTFTFPAGSLNAGDLITATATDGLGNTSEFGHNVTVS